MIKLIMYSICTPQNIEMGFQEALEAEWTYLGSGSDLGL